MARSHTSGTSNEGRFFGIFPPTRTVHLRFDSPETAKDINILLSPCTRIVRNHWLTSRPNEYLKKKKNNNNGQDIFSRLSIVSHYNVYCGDGETEIYFRKTVKTVQSVFLENIIYIYIYNGSAFRTFVWRICRDALITTDAKGRVVAKVRLRIDVAW